MIAEPDIDLSNNQPMRKGKTGRKPGPLDWSKSPVPHRQCTAHKKTGEQCKNPAIVGGTVCGKHGGKAKQVREKAAQRLAEAADQMARRIIGFALDNGIPENVALAAAKDVLDRAGLSAKTNMAIELSAKPFERVFDRIAAGPRESAPAIESGILGEDTDKPVSESTDDVVIGEIDDDVIEDDLLGVQPERESESDVIDVEIVAAQYTDEIMSTGSGTVYPDQDQMQPDEHTAPPLGPLGLGGPTGSGLMSLSDAVEAQADMRARQAARLRDARRR